MKLQWISLKHLRVIRIVMNNINFTTWARIQYQQNELNSEFANKSTCENVLGVKNLKLNILSLWWILWKIWTRNKQTILQNNFEFGQSKLNVHILQNMSAWIWQLSSNFSCMLISVSCWYNVLCELRNCKIANANGSRGYYDIMYIFQIAKLIILGTFLDHVTYLFQLLYWRMKCDYCTCIVCVRVGVCIYY